MKMQIRIPGLLKSAARTCTAVALACTLSLGMGAVAADKSSSAPNYLKIGCMTEIDSLNPFDCYTVAGNEVFQLVYDQLWQFDKNMKPIPDLATSWSMSSDSLTWTLKLRHGVKWSDGKPFTSADVKYTMDTDISSGLKFATILDGITSVTAPDDYTVVVKTKEPKANFLQMNFPILPKHIWETCKDAADLKAFDNSKMVGIGPFTFSSWKKGESAAVTKTPNYFGEKTVYDGVKWIEYSNRSTEAQALKTGEIDVADDLTSENIKGIENYPKIKIYKTQRDEEMELGFNCWTDPKSKGNKVLLDPKVRQAITLSIDRSQIASLAFGGDMNEGSSLLPVCEKLWHYTPTKDEALDYNVSQANALLDSAGYSQKGADGIRLDKQGKPIVLGLLTRSISAQECKAGEMIVGFVAKIGIKVNQQTVDNAALNDKIYKDVSHDMYIWDFTGTVDPTNLLSDLSTDQIGNMSDCYYSNPDYDALVKKQSTQMNQADRQKTVYQAQQILLKDAPYDVIGYPIQIEAVRSDRISGLQQLNGTGMLFFNGTRFNYFTNYKNTSSSGPLQAVIWSIVGVAAAAVVVILIVRSKKKNKEDEE